MGKSTINGPFSIATLNYQRVFVTTGAHVSIHSAAKKTSAGQHGANVYGVPAGVAHSWPKPRPWQVIPSSDEETQGLHYFGGSHHDYHSFNMF